MNLLGADSNPVLRATTTRLLYATMTGTDVAVYRLKETYAQLEAAGIPARRLATRGPRPGADLVMLNGSFQTTLACTIEAVVPKVKESGYTQRSALRYRTDTTSCSPERVASGSPLVDRATGDVVAIHNSHVVGDAKPCREDNPCEVAADGSVTAVKDRSYAQQVAGLTACLAAGSVLDLHRPGCTLVGPRD